MTLSLIIFQSLQVNTLQVEISVLKRLYPFYFLFKIKLDENVKIFNLFHYNGVNIKEMF